MNNIAPNSPISNLNVNSSLLLSSQSNNNNRSSNSSPPFNQNITEKQNQNSLLNTLPMTATSPSPSPLMMLGPHTINLIQPHNSTSPLPSSWSHNNLNSLSGNSNTPGASMFHSLTSISPSLGSLHLIAPSPSSILHNLPPSPLTLRLGMTPSPLPLSPSPLLQNPFHGTTPTPPPSTFAPIPMSSNIPSGQPTSWLSKPHATQASSTNGTPSSTPVLVRPSPVRETPTSNGNGNGNGNGNAQNTNGNGNLAPPQMPSPKPKSNSQDDNLTLAPIRS